MSLSILLSTKRYFACYSEEHLSFKTSSWKITFGSILALVKNRNSRIEGIDDYGTFISQHLKHLNDVG
ncbi:hypothetical protein BY996DRAFT_6591321 [Phakopsora pachyrhizi]|nr:hypothetical protein BY996DRAFT_6591321 [Phakopsora pachyrhizi]